MKQVDSRGIEGFPLQLLIMFIVVAMVVPMSWNYLEAYSVRQTQQTIDAQLSILEAAVRDVYSMGPGNIRVVDMELRGGLVSSLDYMYVGGTPNDVWSNLSSFRYRLGGGAEQYFMITDPNIAMVNITGLLELSEGHWMIEIRTLDEWALQSDMDGDGAHYSWVVEVGLAQ